MPVRPLPPTLKTYLDENKPYNIAHLVKFERPEISQNYKGFSRQESTDYIYITDCGRDIQFDDGSFSRKEQEEYDAAIFKNTASTATPNGVQRYIAHRLGKIGSINEGIEAKASNLSLKIDATSLQSDLYVKMERSGSKLHTDIDLSEFGFREGDKIQYTHGSTVGEAIINRFTEEGDTDHPFTAHITKTLGADASTSSTHQRISIISEELTSLLRGNQSIAYTNYINREVFIYRVYLDPETNQIIGGEPGFYSGVYDPKGAVLMFKGLITGANLNDDPGNKTTMTWTLSSHWGDFVQVKNRITNDSDHRALTELNTPDTDVILRQSYASDLGFEHAERSLNLVATYDKTVTKQRLKKKKKNLGLSTKYTLEDYDEIVPTDIDLRLNLNAKALPVVYGVQKVEGIPVFFDNQKSKTDHIYAAYAICEGSVGGLFDVSLDNKTTICLDANDEDSRGQQNDNESIDVLCQGRADLGQVLVGGTPSQGVAKYVSHVYDYEGFRGVDTAGVVALENAPYYEQATRDLNLGSVGATGILHEKGYSFRDPIDCTFIFHAGLPEQKANNLLLEKASKELFKIQTDFYEGQAHKYWTPNHRLLDTAYVVGEFVVGDGEIELPELTFIVKGRDINCYNYDDSFIHNPSSAYASETSNTADFHLGASVSVSGTGFSTYTTTIADRWFLQGASGVPELRLRLSQMPSDYPTYDINLAASGTSSQWHMLVSDKLVAVGNVSTSMLATVDGYAGSGDGFTISYNSTNAASNNFTNVITATQTTTDGNSEYIARLGLDHRGGTYSPSKLSYSNLYYTSVNTSTTTIGGFKGTSFDSSNISTSDYNTVQIRNAVGMILRDSSNNFFNPANDSLEGHTIILTAYDSDNKPYVQERKIVKWFSNGGTANANQGIALVDQPWDVLYTPYVGAGSPARTYNVQVRTPKDLRVSLNPSMQLLDYIKSERYGRALQDEFIDLDTFKVAALKCDTRSDVTMIFDKQAGVSAPAKDSKYRKTSGGITVFEGRVLKSSEVQLNGTDYYLVTFTDCIGKWAVKYTGASKALSGQLMWRNSGTAITLKTGSGNNIHSVSAFNAMSNPSTADKTLNKVTGTGPSTLVVEVGSAGYSSDGNPVIKGIAADGTASASGFSLYDSDNVKYWKYCGWDSNEQRNVTRHQLNHVIDTGNTVFANINNMLRQFNGILRYSNGKYQLDVKSAANTLTNYEKVYDEDIIGAIKLTDKGSKKTYNSISATIIDPSQNFEGRSVSFFNSTYLKEDRGVPKKGSFDTPAITNYYNARVNIKQFLDESRNGLEIQFKVRPSGLMLLAGEVFSLSYEKFSWVNKLWRITNLNLMEDGTVSVTAVEHNDDAYIVGPEDRPVSLDTSTGSTVALPSIPASPYNLGATQSESGGIEIAWTNSVSFDPATHDIEIYRSHVDARETSITVLSAHTNVTTLSLTGTTNIGIGSSVKGLTTNLVRTAGNFVAGELCTISVLGDTNWNTVAATSSINYSIGDTITIAAGQNGSGTTGEVKLVTREVKVLSKTNNSVTLNHNVSVGQGDSITFIAEKVATLPSGNTYIDPIIGNQTGNVTRYYWIRYKINKPVQNVAGAVNKVVFSNFHPNTNSGVSGVGLLIDVDQVRSMNLSFSNPRQFIYNTTGSIIGSAGAPAVQFPTSCTISVAPINTSGTVNVSFQVKDTAGNNIGSPSVDSSAPYQFTYNAPTGSVAADGFDNMPQSVEITLTDVHNGTSFTAVETVDFTATRLILDGIPGENAIEVSMTNPQHTFPVALDGTIDTSNSGTNIQIFEGSTPLKMQTGPALANAEYTITATSSAVSIGSITGANTTTVTVDPSGLFSGTIVDGTIDFTVSGKRIDGSAFTRTFNQTINIINPGQSIAITVNDQSIEYDNLGATPSPSAVTITVDTFGIATPFIDIVAVDSAGTPNTTNIATNQAVSNNTYTATFNVPTLLANTPVSIEVTAYEATNASNNAVVVAKDKTTVFGVKNGNTTAIVFAYKRAASAPSDNPGVCTVNLGTGKITTANLSNSWGKEPPATGNNPIYFVAATAAGNGATDTINANEWTTPALLAASAKTNVVTADSLVFTKAVDTTLSPASATITAQTQNTTQNGSWTTSSGTLTNVVNTHTGPSCTVAKADFVDGMEVTYTLHSDDGSIADSVVLQQLNDGSQAIQAVLSNATHVLPSATNGVVSSHTGSGTNLQVFEGANELTFTTGTIGNSEYQVSVGNTANITEGTAQAATGQVFCEVTDHSATASGTDTYIITYTITGKDSNGTSFTTTVDQTLSKAKDGVTGTSVATAFIYKRTSTSTAPSLPSGNTTFTFADGSMSFTTANGWDEDIPNTAGRYLWIARATASAAGGTASVLIPDSDWGNVELFAHDPVDIINAVLTNPYQDVGISQDNERTFNGTDTNLQILEGSTVLTPVTSNPGNGEYEVTVTSTGGVDTFSVTANEISSNPDKITAPDITTLTDNVGTRKFNCTGKRLNGESFTNISVEQHFKATNAVGTFSVEPGTDGIIVQFPIEGDRISAPVDTLQAIYKGFDLEDGATYSLEKRIMTPAAYAGVIGTSTLTPGFTATNFTNTFPKQFTGYPYTYRVNLKRTDPNTNLTSTLTSDQIVYYATRDGAKGDSSVAVALSNESHNIPRDADFDVIMDNTGTDIQIQEGAQLLAYVASNPGPGQFSVTATGNGGIAPGSISLVSNPNVLGANPLNLLSLPMSEAFELQDFDGDGQLDSWKFSTAINSNTNTVIADAIDAPIVVQGGSKGERLQAPGGNSYGEYSIRARNHEGVTITSTGEHWFTVFAKAGDLNYIDTPNLITNGEFSSNANNWTLSGDFSWHSSGRVQRVSGSSNSSFQQNIDIVEGKTYRIRYDVEHTGGNSTTIIISGSGTGSSSHGSSMSGSGSQDITMTAGQTATIPFKLFGLGDFRGYFDNVRIEEVSVGTDHVFLRTTADAFTGFVAHEAVFDLTNGNLQSSTSNTVTYISNSGLPTGWYRIGIRVQHSALQIADTSDQSRIQFILGLSDSTGARTFTDVNSINAYLWGAMIEPDNNTATPAPYQVNTGSIARVADHTEAVGGITSNSPSVDYQVDAVGIGGGYLGTIVKKQTFSVINPAATVQVSANKSVVDFDGAGNPTPSTLTYTPTISGIGSNIHYEWNINGTITHTTAASPAKTETGYSESDFPKTVTCTVKSGTTTGSGTFIASDSLGVVATTPSITATITASMGNHILDADASGDVEFNDFENEFKVVVNGTEYGYQASGTTANKFKFGVITVLGGTAFGTLSVSGTGVITLNANSSILSNAAHLQQSFSVPIIENSTSATLGVYILSITKRIGARRNEMIEVAQSGSINNTEAIDWSVGTSLGNQAARDIVTAAIAASSDNTVRPGDSIKVTNSDGNGIRIYNNSVVIDANTTISSVSGSHFSSPVVDVIPGSVIVNGTLGAEKLTSNTVLTNTLRVNNRITVGLSSGTSSASAINSHGKTSFGQNVKGFFLGRHSSNYSLDVGDADNHLRFDGNTGNVSIKSETGGFSLKSGTSGARLEIVDDKIVIRDSNGTIRVQLGNLTP